VTGEMTIEETNGYECASEARRFRPVTAEVIRALEGIVGTGGVVVDAERLEVYSHDETSEADYVRMPEVVVKPRDASEVSQILRLANRETIPVTPRGSGTGLSGGCVPMFGGIVLSMERMNRIIEVDRENLFIVVEPGVTTGEIQRRARRKGCSMRATRVRPKARR